MPTVLFISPLNQSWNLVHTLLLTSGGFLPQWRYRTVGGDNFFSPKAHSLPAAVLAGPMLMVLAQAQRKVPFTCLISLHYFPTNISVCNLLMLSFLSIKKQRCFRPLEIIFFSAFHHIWLHLLPLVKLNVPILWFQISAWETHFG